MNLNFAENIKRLRKEKGITQETLAEALNVTAQSISRWELSICYPDIEMLPSIANYFGVTVDSLLSNDVCSKERDREIFNETIDTLSNKTTESIEFVSEYCRKYPESIYYSFHLVDAIRRYAMGDPDKTEKYMPLLIKNTQRLLETKYRSAVIQTMAMLCDGKELDKWLDMAPYNSDFSRRYCLVARAQARDDWSEMYVQQGINMFECFAVQLNGRFPDSFGASKKVEFQKDILRILESFGNGKGVPDGWKCFYAYRQLVLSACLFALNKTEEAWENFDSAIEKCKYVTNLKDEWLDIGGPVFANVKANKIWNYAIDEKGQTHKLFGLVRHSCADMWLIHSLLTNPRWAWFDSVRETPKYKEALEWVEAAEKKVRSTFES